MRHTDSAGSIAYDTIMVFRDRFKNHILPTNYTSSTGSSWCRTCAANSAAARATPTRSGLLGGEGRSSWRPSAKTYGPYTSD